MTEEYRRGHADGYANGIRDTQPNWIRADERSPEKEGLYWAIGEFLEDSCGRKQGDLCMDTEQPWTGEEWLGDSVVRRILYWAEQPIITPPRELMGKAFCKPRFEIEDHALVEYPEAG